MLKRLRSLFRVLTGRPDFEKSMAEELRFHLEEYTGDLVRSGVGAGEAARRARIEFGGLNSVKEDCRRERGLEPFDELGRELRHAIRLLRKTPGFTVTALLTVALCLGAKLTIFSVIDSILLRPLPFSHAEQLVTVFNTYPKAGVDRDGSSMTNYYERRGRIPAFTSLAIYQDGTAIVGESGSTGREQMTQVSPEFFSTLGVGLAWGRSFTEAEMNNGTDNVVILTDAYWRQHFNADPHVVGRQVRVDTYPKTVIGVLAPDFHFLSSEARLYLPLSSSPGDRAPVQRHSGGDATQMIARVKSGATLTQAQLQIDAQNAALEVDDPQAKMMADAGFRSLVVPLHADHVAAARPILLLLQAGVFGLLLIGMVNLVNLLFIRATGRDKELAVRKALGASRRHVVSEVVVETALLTLVGGLLGSAVGAGGIRILTLLGTDRLPLGAHIEFNLRLALVGLSAAIVMGIALAAPIAWLNLRRDPADALRSESRGGTSGIRAQTLRYGFIVTQIALAFVLLAGAGLLGLSLKRAMAVFPGFRADHVLTGQILLVGNKYPAASTGLQFVEQLVDELDHKPGIVAAGVVNNVPFSGRNGKSAATIKGRMRQSGQSPRGHYFYGVGGDYFKAMGLILRAGRFLTTADSRRGVRVCVIDDDFARYYWPKGDALGQRLFQGSNEGPDSEAFTVVGIIGSAKQAGLTEDTEQGAVYYPYIYRPDSNMFVAVRASLPPELLALTLQTVVRRIDADLAVNDVRPMDERISDSLVARRSPAVLASLFSGIALLLTGIGTYGVLSYAVAQRRREIAVRMALGARPEQIRNQFLFLILRLFAIGSALGVFGAWLTGQIMQTVLFHVPALNSAALAGTGSIMAVVCFAASLIPAYRAARISPMQVLAES